MENDIFSCAQDQKWKICCNFCFKLKLALNTELGEQREREEKTIKCSFYCVCVCLVCFHAEAGRKVHAHNLNCLTNRRFVISILLYLNVRDDNFWWSSLFIFMCFYELCVWLLLQGWMRQVNGNRELFLHVDLDLLVDFKACLRIVDQAKMKNRHFE